MALSEERVDSKEDRLTISTILLNWNRADLLEKTLVSYLETIKVEFELFIIDNASTDQSREIVEYYCRHYKNIIPIFLDKNIGGEAINIGLQQASGEFIHVSENDVEYLSGWDREIIDCFRHFSNLGQLSLFCPVPEDEEVLIVQPSILRHSRGKIVYEALSNVGTTCVFRQEILKRGIKFMTKESSGNFKFPDDSQFSSDIKNMGFMVAWSAHHLARNRGHFFGEFASRKNYYLQNYQSKPWLGEDGWEKRCRKWRNLPKPIRQSIIFSDKKIIAEKSDPSLECPNPQLWSMFDGWTAEVEVIDFIYSIVRLIKPRYSVETGTWHGIAATAAGVALRCNGFGRLTTLEIDTESFFVAQEQIKKNNLEQYVGVCNMSSLEFIPEEEIDLLILDSEPQSRISEFYRFLPKIKKGAVILFHDTSMSHSVVRDATIELKNRGMIEGFLLSSPRGLGVYQFVGGANTKKEVITGDNTGGRCQIRRLFEKMIHSFHRA